jgi:GDP-D-mannose dehydratase
MKKAPITGNAGQVGSYFARPFLNKDYEVDGMIGRARTGLAELRAQGNFL